MSVFGGPSIVTSGLVFDLDSSNPKSYDSKHNLTLYSQDWTQQVQSSQNVTVTAANTTSPDGTVTGQRLTTTQSGYNNDGLIQKLYSYSGKNIPTTTTNLFTFSTYVKQGTSPKVSLVLSPYNGSSYKDLIVTLTWSTLTLSTAGTNYGRNYVGLSSEANGWYRLWCTTDNTFGATDLAYRIHTRDHLNNNISGEYSYIWGSQLEYGNTPGPYILTTTVPILPSNTCIDLSGNGNTGTLVNSPTYNSANGSFTFNGTNNTCDLGFQWPSDFTFDIIFSTNNNSVKQVIISNYSYNAGGLEIAPNLFNFFLFSTSGVNSITTYSVLNNTTYQVVGTKSGTSMNLYVNGLLVGSATLPSSTLSQTQNLRIGNDRVQSLYFNGNIYSAKVYNRALAADEILQNFNAHRGRYGL